MGDLPAAVSYWKNGFFVSKGGYEFTLVLMTVSTMVGLIGPGRLSLDILFGVTLPEAWLFVALAAAALVVNGIGLVVSRPVTPAGARSDEGYRAS